jgi:AraC-like DNA-binding protein
MDALSEVLGHVRLKDTRWACVLAGTPWGLDLEEMKGCVRFHYVTRGSCWVSVQGVAQPRIALSGGDLAVLPHGHAHTVREQPRSRVTSLHEAMQRVASLSTSADHRVKVGGAGAETNLVYGAFIIDDPDEAPILATLPPVIRIIPDAGEPVPSFLQNLQFISRELDLGRPGSKLVLTRMADVILVQLLRAYIESLPVGSEGFLGALRDKHMAAALGMMHQSPEEPWTVARLADEVGLSRSGFAARFAALVGETPLAYLTRLRMRRASVLLRKGATLAKVARMTGYSSEASFSHAFRQWAGVAPGAYRRQSRASTWSDE